MIEKKEIEFSKELDDVLVLVIELVKDIKAKKSVAQIGAENIPNLMAAIGNVDQIPAEAKNKVVTLQTIGYRTGELAAALVE
jgi:predicted ArsR family transcriptional regulator